MGRITFILSAIICFVSLASPAADAAVPDAAALTKRQEEAVQRMKAAAARAKVAAQGVRKALENPAAKIAEDMDEIDKHIDRDNFEPAIGQWNISNDRIFDVPEEKRAVVLAALAKVRIELLAASAAATGQESIKELIERLEPLKAQAEAGDDMANPLRSAGESFARVELTESLPRPELIAIRGHLAAVRATYAARIAKEMLEKATTEFAEFEKTLPEIRKEFEGDESARNSAHSKFTDGLRAASYSLSRVPESEPVAKKMRETMEKLAAEQRSVYTKHYGENLLLAIKENYEFTANQFEGWEMEAQATAPPAADYINSDGSHFSVFNLPRTVAYVDRSNVFFAHVGMQEDAQFIVDFPKYKAMLEEIRKNRVIALDRVHKLAGVLIDELEKLPIEDDLPRDRMQSLADWDLRIALQDDPRQWPMIHRLHKLIDAYDLKKLGEKNALAKIREEAVKTSEGNWTRMSQRVVNFGGFDPLHSALFKGRVIRLEAVHDFSASFKPGEHDLILDLAGDHFAATFHPALKKELAVQLARAKTKITPQDPLELHLLVGDESKLTLLPVGSDKPVELPCRKMIVTGIRFGPVAFIVR